MGVNGRGAALCWHLIFLFLLIQPVNTEVQVQSDCPPVCPPFSHCPGPDGNLTCHCDLGFYFHPELGCVTVRTFPAGISLSALMWNETNLSLETNTAALWMELSGNVSTLFQEVLGTIEGYLSTSVFNLGWSHVTILHQFSTLSPVTEQLLKDTIAPQPCQGQDQGCVLSLREDSYQALSLCDFALCDPFSSDPQCHRGLVTCSCRQGYFKFSSGDHSCTACASGFHWKDDSCQRCPFGFTGFNCDEAFLLTVILQSGLLFLLLAACVSLLILYSRKKRSQKPKLIDSLVLGVPSDVLSLPRAQFSWSRDWNWEEPVGTGLGNAHGETGQMDHVPQSSEIQLKSFGETPRSTVSNTRLGSHNPGFISD